MVRTLAIETSCDDTSLAFVSYENGFFEVEKCILHSQILNHKKYGGVVPELASRLHEEKIVDLIQEMGIEKIKEVDFISYTCCPGLPGSLLVGKTASNVLSIFLDKEKVPVNHIYGHIFSIFADRNENDIKFPLLVLTVSGGHNDIYLLDKKENRQALDFVFKIADRYNLEKENMFGQVGLYFVYKIGFTLDDAAGEAFDKVSKMLGGPYPGGKWIYDLSRQYRHDVDNINFTRIWLKKDEFNFSFSGLKAQVNYKIKEFEKLDEKIKSCIAYEFQESVVETLGKKLLKASKYFGIENIALVGGVSANLRLKEYIKENMEKFNIKNFYTPVKNLYSTDNAAMIGVVGLIKKLHRQGL